MIRHLLVPLDGSRLAESVLPVTAYLAQKLSASVTFVHVIEKNAPAEVHGQPHLRTPDEATAYLNRIAEEILPRDLVVHSHVHTSEVKSVPESILQHVVEFASDLIIMCTHGRSGIHDLLFGSIAQQIIGMGVTPVLLIRPQKESQPSPFECQRILVPLDGNPDHEHALPFASDLAASCKAILHLLMVVRTLGTISGRMTATSRLLPGTTSEMLEITVDEGKDYLRAHAARIQTSDRPVTFEVLRGEPASVITEVVGKGGTSLLALGTHGKSGMDAFWSGSVAPEVCRKCKVPLLLVPVHRSE